MLSNSSKVMLILSSLFGWLLSFPLYGPVLWTLSPKDLSIELLGLVFVLTHLVGFMSGFFIKDKYWHSLMKSGVIVTLLTSVAFLLLDPFLWPTIIGVLGFSSALVVLGWSYPFTSLIKSNRIQMIALIILQANLFLTVITLISPYLSAKATLVITLLPLLLAVFLIFTFQHQPNHTNPKSIPNLPKKFLSMLCITIFGLYLSGGLIYNSLLPLYQKASLWAFFPELVYITAIFFIWKYGSEQNVIYYAYLGASFLGLGFLSFTVTHTPWINYYITIALLFTAFAFLDVYLWTLLGTVSVIHHQPFRIFSLGLATNLFALYAGGISAVCLLNHHNNILSSISIPALTSILLVILAIPILHNQLNRILNNNLKQLKDIPTLPNDLQVRLNAIFPNAYLLTQKELDVLQLIIYSASNKEIATTLHISENTVKSHLKNINRKLEVSSKYELLSRVLNAYSMD